MFIGPSGKIFDQLTNSCGISRNEIYLTNLVKCFLPNCRKPRTDEIETCNSLYLSQEIELAKPEIIVTLGFHVTKFILNEYKLYVPNRIGFKSLFGNLFVSQNTKIIPLHHPATVVQKSKSYDSLEKEYQILKTIQHSCNLIGTCFKFNEYKQGLLPVGFAEKYCFGNWLSCQYKKRTE